MFYEAARLRNNLGRLKDKSGKARQSLGRLKIAWEGLAEPDLTCEGLERQ